MAKKKATSGKGKSTKKNDGMGLPRGALVYCLRSHRGGVGAKLPGGRVLSRKTSEEREELYGLAVDEKRGGLWLSDKSKQTLSFVKAEVAEGDELLFSEVESHTADCLRAPCMLDLDVARGLLVGCFGAPSDERAGGVALYDGKSWQEITPEGMPQRVTHCCWLPDGGYCFVSRLNSSIWRAAEPGEEPVQVVGGTRRKVLCPAEGPLTHLRLRYVQGLIYSRSRKALIVADGSLGAIFEVDLNKSGYRVLVGEPRLVHKGCSANLESGSPDVFLGAIRGLSERPNGELVWLDGEQGRLFSYSPKKKEIKGEGSAFADGRVAAMSGAGLVVV